MTVAEAEKLPRWNCWACGPAEEDASAPASLKGEDSLKSEEEDDSQETTSLRFEKGSIVMIHEHAWAGVNNPGGIAEILAAYHDDDGDAVYDVKYVIGGRKKGVMQKYVVPHHF